MSAPLLEGYVADRSPTGIATAVLVSREAVGKPWTYQPDEGGARRTMYGPLALYGSREDAVLAARFKWRCNGGRPRCPRPVRVDTLF